MTEEKMFNENIKIAYKIVQQYRDCGIEYEDLKQIAFLGLWKAAKTYESEKGYAFTSYAYRVIKNQINMYLRKNKKHFSNRYLSEEIRENIAIADIIADKHDVIDEIEHKIDTERYIHKLKNSVTSYKEKTIITMILNGETQQNIANKIGKTPLTVSKTVKRFRNKLGGKINE